jgi:Xaa-Pro aminopeptidase
VASGEIFHRISRLQQELTAIRLSGTMILDGVNMFYYTGTIQHGVLFVPAEGEPVLFVRRSLERAAHAHKICLDIQEAVRCRLTPGAVPSEIFEEVYRTEVVARSFEENFMGFGSNQVPFLGHGIGLVIDEFPAIARKIDVPLEQNMVLAIEPKKGLKDMGLVGVENTFLVTEKGGEKLTPGSDEITVIG